MPQSNELFSSKRFNLTRFMASLRRMDLELNRAHMKENDGQGKTGQLMLVFEKGKTPMPQEQYDELVGTFIGIEDSDKSGFTWTVQAFNNEAIGRVPAHVFLNCGNPQMQDRGESVLSMRNVRLASAAREKTMVRIAFNLYPDRMHLIPNWVEERLRHADRIEREGLRDKGREALRAISR